MLDSPASNAADRAHQLEVFGVDGIFTFESGHDIFSPLVAGAPATELDLMTKVAIAISGSPIHLAHAGYDLHVMSRGRFRLGLGLGLGLGTQVKVHVQKRCGARWDKPVAKMRECWRRRPSFTIGRTAPL